MRTVTLTPQQMASFATAELRIADLKTAEQVLTQFGAHRLAAACRTAIGALEAGHSEYMNETQRAVSLAAPGDIAAAVNGLVRP